MDKEFTIEDNPMFFKLWGLKCVPIWDKETKNWYDYEIYAKTTKDFEMKVWNGSHPAEENMVKHICKTDTRVRVWMISRFGDVGITDNLDDPRGYDVRGLDADVDLIEYEFIPVNKYEKNN